MNDFRIRCRQLKKAVNTWWTEKIFRRTAKGETMNLFMGQIWILMGGTTSKIEKRSRTFLALFRSFKWSLDLLFSIFFFASHFPIFKDIVYPTLFLYYYNNLIAFLSRIATQKSDKIIKLLIVANFTFESECINWLIENYVNTY